MPWKGSSIFLRFPPGFPGRSSNTISGWTPSETIPASRPCWRGTPMTKILNLIGMSAGGWLGWIVGAWISFFSGFILSVIGMGAGLYAANWLTKRFLP